MNSLFQSLRSLAFILAIAGCWIINNAFTSFQTSDYTDSITYEVENQPNGTQLVQQTKDYLATKLQINASQVTAVYCCQLSDGRYKYLVTVNGQSGFVFWSLVNGIIGVDDTEGF